MQGTSDSISCASMQIIISFVYKEIKSAIQYCTLYCQFHVKKCSSFLSWFSGHGCCLPWELARIFFYSVNKQLDFLLSDGKHNLTSLVDRIKKSLLFSLGNSYFSCNKQVMDYNLWLVCFCVLYSNTLGSMFHILGKKRN